MSYQLHDSAGHFVSRAQTLAAAHRASRRRNRAGTVVLNCAHGRNVAIVRPPGVTVSSAGQVRRDGRIIGFVHSKWGVLPSGKTGKIGESSTVSRADGRNVYRQHPSREAAVEYVIAHGWAYGDPPRETDERG